MHRGFTLIELMLVIGILTVLFSIITINFFSTQNKSYLAEAKDILAADIRSQQTRAMTGSLPISGVDQAGYGIHFASDQYILFTGDTYSAGGPSNTAVLLPAGVTLTTSLPSNDLIFLRSSGLVKNYVPSQASIVLTTTGSAVTVTLVINQFGVIVEGL